MPAPLLGRPASNLAVQGPIEIHLSLPFYPPTPRSNVKDSYQSAKRGTVYVSDPYRWFEQGNVDSHAWAIAQDAFSAAYLRMYPQKETLTNAVQRSRAYTKFDAPYLAQDGRWYWMARSKGQRQSVLYRSAGENLPSAGENGLDDLEATSEIFIDINALSADGSKSLTRWSLSPDATMVAFSVATFGSDLQEIFICRSSNIVNEQDLKLHRVESIARTGYGAFVWAANSKGLSYVQLVNVSLKRRGAMNSTNSSESEKPTILYHQIGTSEDEDEVTLIGPDPACLFDISASFDRSYIILSISKDLIGNKLWIAENPVHIQDGRLEWMKVQDTFGGSFIYIANDGPVFTFMTDVHSDRNHIVRMTLPARGDPTFRSVKHFEDSGKLFLRQYAPLHADYAVAVYSHDIHDRLYLLRANGTPERLDPDFMGTITVTPHNSGFLASFVNYQTPLLVKNLEFIPGSNYSWKIWRDTNFEQFPLSDFVTAQVLYPSKDGTDVPMSLIYHKSTKLDGTAPCLQYGYGANSVALLPFFSPTFLTFARLYGGVVAVANIRGGSEFGSTWCNAGRKAHRLNAVDDFIFANKYLAEHNYTKPSKTAILGWSAGAELVAQSIQRAPAGTFGAAVADRGPHDGLRFPLFSPGLFWTGFMGDPVIPEEFDFLLPLSSVHNVPLGKVLPPTLVVAAREDVRIAAMHSYKLAATLQHNTIQGSGIQLLKIINGAGHETGKGTDIECEEDVLILGFIAQALKLNLEDAKSVTNELMYGT